MRVGGHGRSRSISVTGRSSAHLSIPVHTSPHSSVPQRDTTPSRSTLDRRTRNSRGHDTDNPETRGKGSPVVHCETESEVPRGLWKTLSLPVDGTGPLRTPTKVFLQKGDGVET